MNLIIGSRKGFTLIEMLIVMFILAIGLAIAVPGFMAMGRSNSIKAEARLLKNLLAKTRMDAVRLNQSLTATINTVANSCIVTETVGGANVSTTNFDGVQLTTNPSPLAIEWDAKGMTDDCIATTTCTVNLVSSDASYSVIVSSAGNISIVKL
jgi:prepilin-type N-terminal cleavage/methylation domain-containing protein